jgi:hypothetical protein
MLAFKPLTCTFDIPVETGPAVSNEFGSYRVEPPIGVGNGKPISKTETRICYTTYNRRQPGSGVTTYSRKFLGLKLFMLLREWERRHAFFIVYGQGGDQDPVSERNAWGC